MKLAKFMELSQMSDAELAELLDRDRSTVTRLRNGSTKPSFEVMLALERISEGAIRPSDFASEAA